MSDENTAGIYVHTGPESPDDEEKGKPLFSEVGCFLKERKQLSIGRVPPNSSLPPLVIDEIESDFGAV